MESHLYSPSHNYECPQCSHNSVRRSPRKNLLDRLISAIGLYPYRCQHYSCGKRFYRFRR